MGGFVVTCVDGGRQNGMREVLMMLKMAAFHLEGPAEIASSAGGIREDLQRERAEAKKSEFTVLGGRRDSDILFIRNDTNYTEISIYNALITHTQRAEYVRRIIPVHSIFTLSVENLVKAAKESCELIGTQESFRISLSKRLCAHISSEFIIAKVAESIPRKVDLKTPDKVVMVEIAKDLCAIGVLHPCPGNYNIIRGPREQ
ncbi:uncharacterized protein NESG_00545 [Nematocida ausubeli]|uniref:THUMP domain-containing protein n=1 Tax=Nematocida ausubeli (strain ATCC PRA-371 / ERTm2) TaxID=1913371 RepID=H8ZG05_NEMA1|nr:uncharacterized protein NESG_00545 [Nematocida ausubeli]EHY64449.1 hypothetical protein NERG_02526 [Nematocida ausubeli]KAI5148595.1 tRNA acetyltransferase TAN1 [Nematocida ausubeli]KFG27466.1 hypothetical protein NESG_00545 [Nematocida ausubeli]